MGPLESGVVMPPPPPSPMPGGADPATSSSSDEEDEDQQEVEGNDDGFFEDDESDEDDGSVGEAAIYTQDEIDALEQRLYKFDSELDELNERWEDESLAKTREEVREELSESLSGEDLDAAVEEEMSTLKEQWEERASRLHSKISIVQEKLQEAGYDLTAYYKSLEKQAPEVCCTEAWKNAVWAGVPATAVATEVIHQAEQQLEAQRPVKNRHGKVIEQGASGFLTKRFKGVAGGAVDVSPEDDAGWDFVGELGENVSGPLMGTKRWDPIYTASTPDEAASLGLKLPGEDKVEEIGDLDKVSDPLLVAALASERERGLNLRVNLRKVGEEDDIRKTYKSNRVESRKLRGSRKNLKMSTHKSGLLCGLIPCVEEPESYPTGGVGPDRSGRDRIDSNCSNGPTATNGIVLAHKKRSVTATFVGESSPTRKRSRLLIDMNGIAHVENDNDKSIAVHSESEGSFPCSPGRESSFDELSSVRRKRTRTRLVIDSDDEVTEVEEYVLEADTSQPSFSTSVCETTKLSNGLTVPDMPLVKSSDEDHMLPTNHGHLLTLGGGAQIPSNTSGTNLDPNQPGKFACTGCGTLIKAIDIQRHPILPVGICRECMQRYHSGPFTKGEDGSESECRWCGDGGSIVCCENCDKVFCENCIRRNFGEEELNRILQADWECFMCNREPLKLLTESLVNVLSPVKGRRKSSKQRRNIKRISGYTERTRELHALEKERQERQERWRENEAREVSASRRAQVDSSPNKLAGDLNNEGSIINRARPEDEQVVRICPSISKHLRPHQLEGVRFMWENCIESIEIVHSGSNGQGCILAHSMGLGKTLQVISFLHTVLRVKWSIRTALIVVPLNVLHNWRNEFKRWQPQSEEGAVPVHMLEEPLRNDARFQILRRWHEVGGVLLIGYTSFRSLLVGKTKKQSVRDEFCKLLQCPGPDILVCDEAHTIKNEKAEITKALKKVKTRRRIALTGSPMQNNLMEYYCMVDFVREAYLESPMTFRNKFVNPIENGQLFDSTAHDVRLMKYRAAILHRRLKGFVQRVDMSVLKDELPPKCAFIISVRLSPVQRRLYKAFLSTHGFTHAVDSAYNNPSQMNNTLFYAYHTLSNVWNHPDMLWETKETKDGKKGSKVAVDDFEESDPENTEDKLNSESKMKPVQSQSNSPQVEDSVWWKDEYPKHVRGGDVSGKMLILLDLLRLCHARGDKALIFSQSLKTLDLIERYLQQMPKESGGVWKKGNEWYRFDGTTPGGQRQQFVDRFNDPSNVTARCMLISTKAGCLGINIPAANRVIMVDGSWNPTHDLQALFRVWRFGQTKPVYAYRLCACGTMEEKIYKRQVFKESVAARVLDKVEVGRMFHAQDLMELFRLDDDTDGYDDNGQVVTATAPQSGGASNSSDPVLEGVLVGSFATGLPVAASGPVKDDVMQKLLDAHHPRWIIRYLEHEPLLLDMVEERLTQEEEAQAWDSYQRSAAVEAVTANPIQQTSQIQPTFQPEHKPSPPLQVQLQPQPQLHCSPLPQLPLTPIEKLHSTLQAKFQMSPRLRPEVQASPKPRLQVSPQAQQVQQLQSSPRPELQSWPGVQVQSAAQAQQLKPYTRVLSSPGVQVQSSPQLQQVQQSLGLQSSSSVQVQPFTQLQSSGSELSPRPQVQSSSMQQQLLEPQLLVPPRPQQVESCFRNQQLQSPPLTPSQPPCRTSLQQDHVEQQPRVLSVGKANRYPMCSQLEHEKFFQHIGLKVGDKVTCDTCKYCIGWEAVNVVELD